MTIDNNSTGVDESQATDQSVESVEAEVLGQRVDTSDGTVKYTDTEQPSKDSSVEESFMGENFDPKSIEGKPELEKAYKQMQSAFTKDRQRNSQVSKDLDKYKKWESDLNANPYFQQWTSDMERMAKIQQSGNADLSSMSEEDRVNFLVEQKVNTILEDKVNPELQASAKERAVARTDKFLADNPEAKKYAGQIAEEMKATPGANMEKAWAYVQAGFAKDKAKEEVLNELSVKEDANLEQPGKQPSQPARKKNMTVEEAAELAERQTGHKW